VLAIGALVASSPFAMADVKAGVDAWAKGDFDAAVRQWQTSAATGDPDAQFNLAQAYKLGRGVPRDLSKAEEFYAAAASKGHLQANDNYGLMLFQRGERAKAMPYIRSAAERGDPRAQYILGLALFNGEGGEKDWTRAYAYASLAQQAGLPQATGALAQMDQHISMAERQKAVALAGRIAVETEATRQRQLAAADLGATAGRRVPDEEAGAIARDRRSQPMIAKVERAAADAERAASSATRPMTKPKPTARASTASASPKPSAAVATASTGPWRLQLGAFGVASNADALWARVGGRPELAGRSKLLIRSGNLTKLQAGGFPSQASAAAACGRLRGAGFTCLATRD